MVFCCPNLTPVTNDRSDKPHMNTTESNTAQMGVSAVDLSTALEDQRIAEVKQQLAAAEEAKRLKVESIKREQLEGILQVPSLLGFDAKDFAAVQALIDEVTGKTHNPALNPPKSGKGRRIPQQTLDQMKVMLEAKATIAAVAKHLRVSEATVNGYKSRWGLTTPKKDGAKRGRHQIPFQVRARIEKVLAQKDHAPITQLSKEFGVSRQSLYAIGNKLKHAA